MFRQLLFTFFLVLPGILTLAQHPPYISGSVQGGFLVAHRSNIKHLVKGHTMGMQVQVEWPADGTKTWHREYGLPSLGIEAAFSGTGNPDQLGYLYSVNGFTRLPLRTGIVSQQNLELGIGIGYATKTWDLEDNVRAPVLGSHVNTSILLQYEWRQFITREWYLRCGLRMHHLSNGAYQLPNTGTNVFAVFVGVTPSEKPVSFYKNGFYQPSIDFGVGLDTMTITLNAAVGLKEVQDPLGKKYAVYHLGGLMSRRVTYKSSFSLGLDLWLNRSMDPLLSNGEEQASASDQLLAGINLGYGLHMNQWTLRIMCGRYLVDPYGGYGDWYMRFGLRYWINQRIFAQMMLKTHWAKADHGEWGIGIRIGK